MNAYKLKIGALDQHGPDGSTKESVRVRTVILAVDMREALKAAELRAATIPDAAMVIVTLVGEVES